MSDPSPELERLQRRLKREHQARQEAEAIAERVTADLYATSRQLEHANAELHRTNEEVQAVNQTMRDFVAVASHDLRSPLTAILGFSDALTQLWTQLEDAQKDLRAQAGKEKLLKTVSDMHATITAVEDTLLEPAMRLSDDKYFVQAYHVYTNLIWLNGEVGPGAGDVAGGTDYRPTDTSVAVLDTIEKDLNGAKAEYDALVRTQIPAFNKSVAGTGIKPLTAG